ncbi:MAG: hypothetical protein ABGX00_17710 [Allomuricauda sp.]
MKLVSAFSLFLVLNVCLGQSTGFQRIEIHPTESPISIKNFKIYHTYLVNDYTYLIGEYQFIAKKYGLIMMVLNKHNSKIFESAFGGDQYYLTPYFFRSENNMDDILILLASGAEECWGTTVYRFKNEKIERLGYINLCAVIDGDFVDLPAYSKITTSGDEILITFEIEQVYFQEDNQEQFINGNEIKYMYSNNTWKRILKNSN